MVPLAKHYSEAGIRIVFECACAWIKSGLITISSIFAKIFNIVVIIIKQIKNTFDYILCQACRTASLEMDVLNFKIIFLSV